MTAEKHYSDVTVYGRIKQETSQGPGEDDVVVLKTLAPITSLTEIPTSSTGSEPAYKPGQTAIIDNVVYICTTVGGTTGNWTYTWTTAGDPSYANTIENIILQSTTHLDPASITISSTTYPKAVNITRGGLGLYDKTMSVNNSSVALESTSDTDLPTIYAPTTAGTSGQLLESKGAGNAPEWKTIYNNKVSVNGSATTAVTTGSTAVSVYAPSGGGTAGQILKASGNNSAPVWEDKATTVTASDSKLVTGGAVATALGDGSVTKVGTSTVGGALQTMYLSSGVPTAGTQLYNKNITLNGSSTNHNVITQNDSFALSFYAPTTAGASGQVLRSSGSGAPAWESVVSAASGIVQDATGIPTAGAVWAAIDNLPEPMIFKGTLGTGGTVTSLSTASSSNEGWTYKVITAGQYVGQTAKVGDTFICAKTGDSSYEWVLIPSGDEPSGTVTNVATGTGLTGGPITASGTISIATSYQNQHYDSTISVQAASDYSLTGITFKPRIIQVYDGSGYLIHANTKVETVTANSVTTYTVKVTTSYALDTQETWTVNILGW